MTGTRRADVSPSDHVTIEYLSLYRILTRHLLIAGLLDRARTRRNHDASDSECDGRGERRAANCKAPAGILSRGLHNTLYSCGNFIRGVSTRGFAASTRRMNGKYDPRSISIARAFSNNYSIAQYTARKQPIECSYLVIEEECVPLFLAFIVHTSSTNENQCERADVNAWIYYF